MTTSAGVRSLLPITVTLAALLVPCADAVGTAGNGREISTAGVSLRVPVGWQARVSKTPACDPERLIVASSTATQIGPSGRLSSPPAGAVLVVLLEDRYRQDQPVGDLRRPQHFSVSWNHLARLEPCCGLPASPASMRYVKIHGRYLGFLVYPGAAVGGKTREATVTHMDSLHLNP